MIYTQVYVLLFSDIGTDILGAAQVILDVEEIPAMFSSILPPFPEFLSADPTRATITLGFKFAPRCPRKPKDLYALC